MNRGLLSNNAKGANQYGAGSLLDQFPELPSKVQELLNDGIQLKDIPNRLLDKGISVKLRSLNRLVTKGLIKTTRRNKLPLVEQGEAILELTQEDVLERWGARRIQTKLKLKEIHLTRDFISVFRKANNPEGVAGRHPVTRQLHGSRLNSMGSNEEWGADGHEKLSEVMGIQIYGIIDKFSRLELLLIAVPDARKAEVVLLLYLRLIKRLGRMPVRLTLDKGPETGQISAVQTQLRNRYAPEISVNVTPASMHVKSVYNITRERAWGPLYRNELANILKNWDDGKLAAGYNPTNPLHKGVALWLWSQVVQDRLDRYKREMNVARTRFDAKSALPTGGRRKDFYERPWDWNGTDMGVPIPEGDIPFIDELIERHTDPKLLQFGSDEMIGLCEELYEAVGAPELSSLECWGIFKRMIEIAVPQN